MYIDKVEHGVLHATIRAADAADLISGLEAYQNQIDHIDEPDAFRAIEAMICLLERAKEQADAQDRAWVAARGAAPSCSAGRSDVLARAAG
jgi:hypothetical protein